MTSLRTAKKRGLIKWRRDCRDWRRRYGTANLGASAHNPEMLCQIARLGLYESRYQSIVLARLSRLWRTGNYEAHFKAVRVGRQACFILAGIHLAAQRRAVAQ